MNDAQAGIIYDDKDVTATVNVTGEPGNYTASVSYEKDGKSANEAVFDNTTDETKFDIKVTKKWAGGAKGDKAVIELVADGARTGVSIELNENGLWTGTFEGVKCYAADGHEIVYGVAEDTDEWDYKVESDGKGGFIVTNSPKKTGPVGPDNKPNDGNETEPENVPTGDVSKTAILMTMFAATSAEVLLIVRRRRSSIR